MRTAPALLAFGLNTLAIGQVIQNPGFESDCTFDMTGWDWFCSVPDFYPSDGHASCYSLMMPPTNGSDPCFANGEAPGVHTLVQGMQVGIPYQVSVWEYMSSPTLNSDFGFFAMTAGQTPSSFPGLAQLDTWPTGWGNPGSWIQDIATFTIPQQYAGMDFYFFIEYSIAPDTDLGGKYFDDITLTDLSTGIPAPAYADTRVWPNPADQKIQAHLPEAPLSVTATDPSGKLVPLMHYSYRNGTLEADVDQLSAGLFGLRVTMASSTLVLRFVKA